MTTKENFKKAWTEKGLKHTENADGSLTMTSYNGKMETTYFFNEKGDLVNWSTKNF